jgi:hypothetical protein
MVSHKLAEVGENASFKIIYQSCKRTVDEEEFLMVRFQLFCLLTGTIAFVSIRRQKAANASLFDQRIMRPIISRFGDKTKRRVSDQPPGQVEMISREEVQPLTENQNNALDIV